MLVRFIVDDASLRSVDDTPIAVRKSQHLTLLRQWSRFGVLVHNSDVASTSAVCDAISTLPPSIADLWRTALRTYPSCSVPGAWDGHCRHRHDPELPRLAIAARVIFVDGATAHSEFGVPTEECSVVLPDIDELEICRIDAAQESRYFQRALSLAKAVIPARQSCDEVWKDRFRPFATSPAHFVSVVDRYAIGTFLKRDTGTQCRSGLSQFLKRLTVDCQSKKVIKIYAAWLEEFDKEGVTFAEVRQRFGDFLSTLNLTHIPQVDLYMPPDKAFKWRSHGRFIRFDGYVWRLDTGLEVLEGGVVARDCDAALMHVEDAPEFKDREVGLREFRGRLHAQFLGSG